MIIKNPLEVEINMVDFIDCLESRLSVEELLAKQPDESWVAVYKPTGIYYDEKKIYEDLDK